MKSKKRKAEIKELETQIPVAEKQEEQAPEEEKEFCMENSCLRYRPLPYYIVKTPAEPEPAEPVPEEAAPEAVAEEAPAPAPDKKAQKKLLKEEQAKQKKSKKHKKVKKK